MANVTATDRMKDDPRFDTAGVLMGVDGDLVRFRMIRLWSWQTEHYTPEAPTYVVSRVALIGVFKRADAPEALVAADLVEECPDGFYIRGTEGVIEWLWKKKAAGAKGYAEKAKRGGAQGVPKQTLDSTGSGAQVVSSPCDPRSEIRDPEKIRERESGSAAPAPLSLLPLDPPVAKPDQAAELAAVAVDAINAATGRTFEPTSIATLRLARALVKAGTTEADVRTVVSAKAAEWGSDPSFAKRICPGTLLAADNFARYLDEARAGPVVTRGSPANGKPRALGQVPISHAPHTDGEQIP